MPQTFVEFLLCNLYSGDSIVDMWKYLRHGCILMRLKSKEFKILYFCGKSGKILRINTEVLKIYHCYVYTSVYYNSASQI